MEPIRILQVVPAMNAGGMETFIMNVYRAIDRSAVQFDFLYHYDMPCFYDEEILALGGRIHKLTVRQDNNLFRYLKELRHFFLQHPEYRIIHGHYSGFGMFYNTVARRCGIRVRAGHSHNTNYEKNLTGLLDRMMSFWFVYGLTDRFACGMQAGKALYRGRPFTFLPNGIDAARFAAADPQGRAALRARLNLAPQEIVYGHIGRFNEQKNHAGLLDIFSAVLQRQPNARLLLLGEGPLLEQTRRKAAALGDRVIFAGVQSNTDDYYRAMDVFLLPSLFEGLPVVLVEAQASGLPCLASDKVDPTADFTGRVQFLPIDRPERWAEAACQLDRRRNADALEQTRRAGYDIRTTAAVLQKFYLEKYPLFPR